MLTHERPVMLAVIVASLLIVVLPTATARADDCTTTLSLLDVDSQSIAGGASKTCGGTGVNSQTPSNTSTETRPPADPKADWKKQVKAIIKRNAAEVSQYADCLAASPYSVDCQAPQLEDIPAWAEALPGPLADSVPPQLIAYTAAARLGLAAPKPIIGPPPSINPWKIAAVGYPLWLSTDADIDPPAVSDSVFDLSVRVKAHLAKVVFAMGDGKTVTCTNLSQAWGRWVEPGIPSPTCGYRYTQPPRGSRYYTVTAHSYWNVAVTINGTTYPVTLAQRSSVRLPVGELQVVVR